MNTIIINQKLDEIFKAYPNKTSEKAIKIYNHLLNAHQIWNNRINPKEKTFGVWQYHPIQNCKEIDQINFEHSLMIIDDFELTQTINYTTTQGHQLSNKIQDLLFHIINHSTYHRAQIATEFKENGMEPLSTDYVIFKR